MAAVARTGHCSVERNEIAAAVGRVNSFPQVVASVGKSDPCLSVELSGKEIIVRKADFYAVYYKPTDRPQLILRYRSETDDHELLARTWKVANDKARETGSIEFNAG